MPCGQRHLVEVQRAGLSGRAGDGAIGAAQRQPRHARQRLAACERVADQRQHAFAIVDHDRGGGRHEERLGVGSGGMAADENRYARRQRAHAVRQRDDFVGLERVHRRDADQIGARRADLRGERSAEAQIGERHAVAPRFERGRDVFHAERFDAEERTEAEPLVRRDGAKQQNIHASRRM
jgi:hypothetical protein